MLWKDNGRKRISCVFQMVLKDHIQKAFVPTPFPEKLQLKFPTLHSILKVNKPQGCDRLPLSPWLMCECEVILKEEMTNTQTTRLHWLLCGYNDQRNTQISTLRSMQMRDENDLSSTALERLGRKEKAPARKRGNSGQRSHISADIERTHSHHSQQLLKEQIFSIHSKENYVCETRKLCGCKFSNLVITSDPFQ